MKLSTTAKANLTLLATATIWGSTFVILRDVLKYLRPFAYNGLRFTAGASVLLIFAIPLMKKRLAASENPRAQAKTWLQGGFCCGFMLFAANSFQIYGLQWTTASKAGFITAMYVVIVPLVSLFFGKPVGIGQALGVVFAVVGVYFLSSGGDMSFGRGEFLALIGAFFWAGHVISVGHFSPKMDSIILGAGQSSFCALFSLINMAILGEFPSLQNVSAAWFHILYGGVVSVGVGFTLQVVGQKNANPTAAAIILQMEAVVAALSGWLIMHEIITGRMIFGAATMLAGFLICVLWPKAKAAGEIQAPYP